MTTPVRSDMIAAPSLNPDLGVQHAQNHYAPTASSFNASSLSAPPQCSWGHGMTRAEIEIMLAEAIDDFDEPVDNSSGVPRARSMGTSLPIPDSTLSASLLHHSLRSQRSSHIGSSLYVNSQCDDSLQRVATQLKNSRLTGSLPVEYTKRRKSHLDQPHDLFVSPTSYPTDSQAR